MTRRSQLCPPPSYHRRLVAAVLFVALLLLAVLALAGCDDNTHHDDAQQSGQRLTEQAFRQQQAAVPYRAPRYSLERRNLAEREKREDNPSAVGYVYLMSFGKPIGYYVIKGKVSSTQSQMTTGQLVIDGCPGVSDRCPTVVDAPGDDGSYGPNEPGIFFFTVDGTMVTTPLDYIHSDQPLPIDVPRLDPGKAGGPKAGPRAS